MTWVARIDIVYEGDPERVLSIVMRKPWDQYDPRLEALVAWAKELKLEDDRAAEGDIPLT